MKEKWQEVELLPLLDEPMPFQSRLLEHGQMGPHSHASPQGQSAVLLIRMFTSLERFRFKRS
jgi:hypothetical protein